MRGREGGLGVRRAKGKGGHERAFGHVEDGSCLAATRSTTHRPTRDPNEISPRLAGGDSPTQKLRTAHVRSRQGGGRGLRDPPCTHPRPDRIAYARHELASCASSAHGALSTDLLILHYDEACAWRPAGARGRADGRVDGERVTGSRRKKGVGRRACARGPRSPSRWSGCAAPRFPWPAIHAHCRESILNSPHEAVCHRNDLARGERVYLVSAREASVPFFAKRWLRRNFGSMPRVLR